MKKSEMISKIAHVLHECRLYRVNVDVTTDLETAEVVLNRIEKLGMLPPKIEGKYDNIPTVTPTGNHWYSWKRGWEREEE